MREWLTGLGFLGPLVGQALSYKNVLPQVRVGGMRGVRVALVRICWHDVMSSSTQVHVVVVHWVALAGGGSFEAIQ